MKYSLLLIAMIFMHIVDDYYLQGVLAKMKQRDWWYSAAANMPLNNEPDKCKEAYGFRNIKPMYEKDYIVALIMHAFSWSFMVMLPILIQTYWRPHWAIILMFGINVVVHAIVDDLKSNKKKINLIADQIIHIFQVWAVWLVHYLICIL